MDDVYVDYHGAAMQAVKGAGLEKKEIKHFSQLIKIIGDGKVNINIIPPTF